MAIHDKQPACYDYLLRNGYSCNMLQEQFLIDFYNWQKRMFSIFLIAEVSLSPTFYLMDILFLSSKIK